MKYKTITYEKKDSIGIVSFNCPPANVFTEEMIADLDSVLSELECNETIRAVLFRSLNKKIFLSGGDISLTSECIADNDLTSELAYVRRIQSIIGKLERMPKPTLASINGHALGGGFELSMACDFRLMSDDNRIQLGVPEIDLGFTPGVGGLFRISRKFGQHLALKMGLGLRLGVQEAYKLGIAEEVFPPEQLFPESIKFAQQLSKLPTKSVGLIKKIVLEGYNLNIQDVYELELCCLEEALRTEDLKEGITAYLEKRTPIFIGK